MTTIGMDLFAVHQRLILLLDFAQHLEHKNNLDEDKIASKKWCELKPEQLPACKGEMVVL